jgi:cytochrome c1
MKTKKQELDIDFIQSKPLTKEEQAKLSEFIQQLKNKKKKTVRRKAA